MLLPHLQCRQKPFCSPAGCRVGNTPGVKCIETQHQAQILCPSLLQETGYLCKRWSIEVQEHLGCAYIDLHLCVSYICNKARAPAFIRIYSQQITLHHNSLSDSFICFFPLPQSLKRLVQKEL